MLAQQHIQQKKDVEELKKREKAKRDKVNEVLEKKRREMRMMERRADRQRMEEDRQR